MKLLIHSQTSAVLLLRFGDKSWWLNLNYMSKNGSLKLIPLSKSLLVTHILWKLLQENTSLNESYYFSEISVFWALIKFRVGKLILQDCLVNASSYLSQTHDLIAQYCLTMSNCELLNRKFQHSVKKCQVTFVEIYIAFEIEHLPRWFNYT